MVNHKTRLLLEDNPEDQFFQQQLVQETRLEKKWLKCKSDKGGEVRCAGRI